MNDSQHNYPSSYLYHYTSHAGLMGIIGSKKIWATNILYLNDSEEIKQAINVVLSCLDIIAESDLSKTDEEFIHQFFKRVESITNTDNVTGIFVCSFSAKSDILSQWRGYCPNTNGVCIGFDFNREISRKLLKSQGFYLVECIYADPYDLPPVIVKNYIGKRLKTFQEFSNKMKLSERIDKGLTNFDQELLKIAPSIKHPAFFEENEWRLISNPIPISSEKIKYRDGKSMLIPYVEFKLTETDDEFMNIPEIWIGPTPYRNLALYSLKNFLNSNHIFAFENQLPKTPFDIIEEEIISTKTSGTQIYLSKAPYRTK